MNKKAQSALEYLSTYAWALLALFAIIGAIIYFGFGDVQSKVPSECTFGTGFSCGSFYGIDNGSFAFELKNMQRTAVNITALTCTFSETDFYDFNLVNTTVPVGDSAVLFCNASKIGGLTGLDGKEKYSAKVYYRYDEAESLPKAVSGELIIGIADDSSVLQQYIDVAIPEYS